MKSEDKITHKEIELEVHKIINNQTKDKSLCIWTWIIIKDKSSFNILHQFIMTLKRWSDRQTSAVIIIHDCWE